MYIQEDQETSAAVAFVAGVMVGMVAGLLLAPRAGSEIRESLKEYAAAAMDDIMTGALETGRTYIEAMVERGKQYLERNLEDVLEPAKTMGVRR